MNQTVDIIINALALGPDPISLQLPDQIPGRHPMVFVRLLTEYFYEIQQLHFLI